MPGDVLPKLTNGKEETGVDKYCIKTPLAINRQINILSSKDIQYNDDESKQRRLLQQRR